MMYQYFEAPDVDIAEFQNAVIHEFQKSGRF